MNSIIIGKLIRLAELDMKCSIALFIILNLFGYSGNCQTLDSQKSLYANGTQSNDRWINQLIQGRKLYIRDSSLYSPTFISDLRWICPKVDSLIIFDDTLYVFEKQSDGKSTIRSNKAFALPAELPLNEAVLFNAEKEGKKYDLKLKRVNYTEIDFELRIDDQVKRTGQAMLFGTYFFGSECGPDENGKEYCSNQYFSTGYFNHSDCYIRLTVEIRTGTRVSFSEYCKKGNTGIKNIPTLLREAKHPE